MDAWLNFVSYMGLIMKKRLYIARCCLFLVLAVSIVFSSSIATSAKTTGTQSENKTYNRGRGTGNKNSAKKGSLKVERGNLYYYIEGRKYRGGWITVKGNKYYFDKEDGAAFTGWQKIGKHKYYFHEKTAVLQKNKWIGKFYVNRKGIRTNVPATKPSETKLRILMVGNSFTRRNEMPEMLAELTDAEVVKYTYSGESLSTYSDSSTDRGARLRRIIKKKHWDYVIIQEKSAYPALRKKSFSKNATKLCNLIRSSGVTPLLYATWAYEKGSEKLHKTGLTYNQMYRQTSNSYHKVAIRNHALIADVGEAFFKSSRSRKLYAPDGFHPNKEGSKLAAETIAGVILKWEAMHGN